MRPPSPVHNRGQRCPGPATSAGLGLLSRSVAHPVASHMVFSFSEMTWSHGFPHPIVLFEKGGYMVIWRLINIARIWPPPVWHPQVSLASHLYKKGYFASSGWCCCWTRGRPRVNHTTRFSVLSETHPTREQRSNKTSYNKHSEIMPGLIDICR